MSTVSFLAHQNSGILSLPLALSLWLSPSRSLPLVLSLSLSLPIECFPLTYDLSGFKSRINKHLLTLGSF